MDRAAFLAERRTGIGSSDAASLMNVGYGCKRRLWYDKVGVPADYPFEGNEATEIGAWLEPFFIQKYSKDTGREVVSTGQAEAARHADYPYFFAHPDGIIKHGDVPGALEIKSPGRAVFYKMLREGLPEDHILQLQWSTMVLNTRWGSFGIGSRDSGALKHWDVMANPDLWEVLIAEGVNFWQTVENGRLHWESQDYALDHNRLVAAEMYAPPRLSPDDSRCHRCGWRDTCQGNALIEISGKDNGDFVERNDLLPLYSELKERDRLLQQAEDLVDEVKEELKTAIGDTPRVLIAGHRVHYAPQVTNRWDGAEQAEYIEALWKKLDAMAGQGRAGQGQPWIWIDDLRREFPKPQKKPSVSRPFRAY